MRSIRPGTRQLWRKRPERGCFDGNAVDAPERESFDEKARLEDLGWLLELAEQ